MEVASSSENIVTTYQSTRRHNPEDQTRHFLRRENLKSVTRIQLWWGKNRRCHVGDEDR
jgi:hypothetical protein